MMTCQDFRASLQPGTADPVMLDHLRHCDGCLDHAVAVDPDLFFRSLGGDDLVPSGGIDAFVSDVMSQVRVRKAETALAPRRSIGVWQRLAIAATVAAGVGGASLVYRFEAAAPLTQTVRVVPAAIRKPVGSRQIFVTKSLVESYSSRNATIVEMPDEGTDTKVVMIFDDKLPADL